MRRRLYFLLPNIESARRTLDDMLLARIEERHVRFLTRRGQLPPDLPEATVFQKTDVLHGAALGGAIGAAGGALGGALAVLFPPEGMALQLVTVLVTCAAGALFGAWVASMAATAVPNSQLKPFADHLGQGRVLMIVDVPFRRVSAITEHVARRHPEAIPGGVEPTVPAFP